MLTRSKTPESFSFPSRAKAAGAASNAIASAVGKQRCTLLLSGGSTPGPVYENLSHTPLDWSRVHVAPVDERWVEENDPGSNARLIKGTLIQNNAAQAPFTPMKSPHTTPESGQASVEMAYQQLPAPYFVVLGMGEDGHVASWFASAPEYGPLMQSKGRRLVAPVNPLRSDITGDYTSRMTITPAVLRSCSKAFLLINGASKIKLLQDWLENDTPPLPIHHAIDSLGSRLTIFTSE
ncbi:MAG: 6-phosphogluconolactonase [Parvibaculales bacterium]